MDWGLVGSSALWMTGLAVWLAALGYHEWLAHEAGLGLRDQFTARSWGISFALGMALVCMGVGSRDGAAWWERGLWLGLALLSTWRCARHARRG